MKSYIILIGVFILLIIIAVIILAWILKSNNRKMKDDFNEELNEAIHDLTATVRNQVKQLTQVELYKIEASITRSKNIHTEFMNNVKAVSTKYNNQAPQIVSPHKVRKKGIKNETKV